jgi:hypothetical protein
MNMNRLLLALAISVLSGSLLAQESPTTPKAARVLIIQGPEIELAKEHLTIIRWTTNNPGGHPCITESFIMANSNSCMSETVRSPIRLNPDHSSTVFRVRLDNLKPRTTYYYRVDSMEANGTRDGVKSSVNHFTTPQQP